MAADKLTAKEKIAGLSDVRLQAFAFRAWRAMSSKNDRARKKAIRLKPLFEAEIATRKKRQMATN